MSSQADMTCCCCEGEVISQEELQRRQQQAQRAAHVYFMQLAPGLVIDARRKGNIARLINHSCSPNCETQKWTDAATGQSKRAYQVAQSSSSYDMVCMGTMRHAVRLGKLHDSELLTALRLYCSSSMSLKS